MCRLKARNDPLTPVSNDLTRLKHQGLPFTIQMKPIEVEIFENVLDIAIYLANLRMSGVKNLANVSVKFM